MHSTRKSRSKRRGPGATSKQSVRPGQARPHDALANQLVHVFVDDQNLFYGIVNGLRGPGFRIDFGRLLLAACRDSNGQSRGVGSAYIAGVIPEDDSFWEIADRKGFIVRRGYLGSNGRSKLDDAYLIRDITSTLYESSGPSTVVLVAGDADYVPPLELSAEKGWRNEVAFIEDGASAALRHVVHEIRLIRAGDIELYDRI